MIYLGADHGGFQLKEAIEVKFKNDGITIEDLGVHSPESSDYPDIAAAVAQKVVANPGSLGILLCRNGQGVCIAANKIKGARAAVAWSPEIAASAREHDDANIVCLAADFTTEEVAINIAKAFIGGKFEAIERRTRRLEKLAKLEQ